MANSNSLIYPIALMLQLLLLVAGGSVYSQVPFNNEGRIFMIHRQTNELLEMSFTAGNSSIQLVTLGNPGVALDAMGFRRTDNLLYALDPVNHGLYRIDATGEATLAASPVLDQDLFYLAGDVHPNGNSLVAIGSSNNLDEVLVEIDLESGNYEVNVIPLTEELFLQDIAFDPGSNVLYGYDKLSRRFVTIFNNSITFLPSSLNILNQVEGLYFDAFGDLFAYGKTAFGAVDGLFSVDKITGEEYLGASSAQNPIGDVASCPYSVELKNLADPEIIFPCGEVVFQYSIANGTGQSFEGVGLEHHLPAGFTFQGMLSNPYSGTVNYDTASGLFKIEEMSVFPGINKIRVAVEAGDLAGGQYNSQAYLENLPANLGSQIISDNPGSFIQEDSTGVVVNRFEEDSLFFNGFVCHGSTLVLDASSYGSNIQWNDGSSESELSVTQGGIYTLDAASGCQELYVSYEVVSASCPYTIEVHHVTEPDTIFPCSELIYRYILENDSGEERYDVYFADSLPTGFTFREILRNPLGGDLVTSLPGNQIIIRGMTLRNGLDTLDLLVEVGDIDPGRYMNRAVIYNLPAELGPVRGSDDPRTLLFDSTALVVLGTHTDTVWLEDTICQGGELVLDASPYGMNYTWSTGSMDAGISVFEPGDYSVTLFDGCEPSLVYFEVRQGTPIRISYPWDIIHIHQGESFLIEPVILNTGDSTFIKWVDLLDYSLSCLDCATPHATPLESVTYQLFVSNGVCGDSLFIPFEVDQKRRIYSPTVFSPNSDGINDYFFLQSPDFGLIKSLVIADRWGGQVFHSGQSELNVPHYGWDGSYKGEKASPGVYAWQAEIEFIDGKSVVFTGAITLVK